MGENLSGKWKCHTPNLLAEILKNQQAAILYRPIQVFGGLLDQVATRCAQLNDPVLNDLMCKLTLYVIADPEERGYDQARVSEIERLRREYESMLTS